MRRYAFIDVHNTKGSASILGFTIDAQKLYDYLTHEKWSCSGVFWYAGRIETEKHEREREKIESIGYTVRDKITRFHKKVATFDTVCPKCGHSHEHVQVKKKLPKANCDVELSVDCIELAQKGDEFLIFTGDGDFKYLVEKLHEKDVRVRLFSTRKQDKYGDYRFSTRYSDLLKDGEGQWLWFMELDNLKNRLKKDAPELEEGT